MLDGPGLAVAADDDNSGRWPVRGDDDRGDDRGDGGRGDDGRGDDGRGDDGRGDDGRGELNDVDDGDDHDVDQVAADRATDEDAAGGVGAEASDGPCAAMGAGAGIEERVAVGSGVDTSVGVMTDPWASARPPSPAPSLVASPSSKPPAHGGRAAFPTTSFGSRPVAGPGAGPRRDAARRASAFAADAARSSAARPLACRRRSAAFESSRSRFCRYKRHARTRQALPKLGPGKNTAQATVEGATYPVAGTRGGGRLVEITVRISDARGNGPRNPGLRRRRRIRG